LEVRPITKTRALQVVRYEEKACESPAETNQLFLGKVSEKRSEKSKVLEVANQVQRVVKPGT